MAIPASEIARFLESMGIDRCVAVDLHDGQIQVLATLFTPLTFVQGFFSPTIPVDNLESTLIGFNYIMKGNENLDLGNLTILSPDAAGVTRAKKFQQLLRTNGYPDTGLAMIVKYQDARTLRDEMYLVGKVASRDILIVDDMIDTAVRPGY